MQNIVPMTQENLPYIVKTIEESRPDHIDWIQNHINKMDFYARIGRKYYVWKDREVNGGFVYPFTLVSDEYLDEHPGEYTITNQF